MKDINLMEEALNIPKKGAEVEGVVVSVKADRVLLDLGTFTEGELALSDYTNDKNITSFEGLLKYGDKVLCIVADVNKNSDDTYITVTRLPMIRKEQEEIISKFFESESPVTVTVTKEIKGGLISKVSGVDVFIPRSQIDVNYDREKNYVGEVFDVKLIERKDRGFVGSRRILQSQELNNNKDREYDSIKLGDTITGKVAKVENFSAIIKYDYNIALLKISQISHEKIESVPAIFKVGDEVTAKVIKKENGKLEVSIRELLETPHEIYAKDNKISDVVSGTVVQKLPIGIIVELAKNVTALIHKNEFSWNPNDNSMASYKIGDTLEAAIISLDVKQKRIGLSKRVLIDNPWSRVNARVGDLTDVKVAEIIPGKGLTVNAYGVDGFIAKNDLVFTEKQTKIEDAYQVGDDLKAIVVQVNPKFWELKLSVKKHVDETERVQFEQYMESQQEVEEKISLGDMFKDILK